ncbi:MAG: hypothetical protein RBS24_06070 [Bacilli bacterium]|nr:hypothetical protein [Bacilli bacterium]
MNEKKVDEIIAKIAKEHSIILDRNDPVFAVITANECMFEDFITRIDKAIAVHSSEIEGMTAKYIADAKQLAEIKIGAAVAETFKVLEERHKKALIEIETATQKASDGLLIYNAHVKLNYWVIMIATIAIITIGIFIGKVI